MHCCGPVQNKKISRKTKRRRYNQMSDEIYTIYKANWWSLNENWIHRWGRFRPYINWSDDILQELNLNNILRSSIFDYFSRWLSWWFKSIYTFYFDQETSLIINCSRTWFLLLSSCCSDLHPEKNTYTYIHHLGKVWLRACRAQLSWTVYTRYALCDLMY